MWIAPLTSSKRLTTTSSTCSAGLNTTSSIKGMATWSIADINTLIVTNSALNHRCYGGIVQNRNKKNLVSFSLRHKTGSLLKLPVNPLYLTQNINYLMYEYQLNRLKPGGKMPQIRCFVNNLHSPYILTLFKNINNHLRQVIHVALGICAPGNCQPY